MTSLVTNQMANIDSKTGVEICYWLTFVFINFFKYHFFFSAKSNVRS